MFGLYFYDNFMINVIGHITVVIGKWRNKGNYDLNSWSKPNNFKASY